MSPLPFLSDPEISDLCAGLEQPAAQVRYLKGLGLLVSRKPNGRPLLARSEFDRVLGAGRFTAANAPRSAGAEPDMGALLKVIQGGRRGQKTQGR
jgi:hypothetical protein